MQNVNDLHTSLQRKEIKWKDYAFQHQIDEQPSIIPGCPGIFPKSYQQQLDDCCVHQSHAFNDSARHCVAGLILELASPIFPSLFLLLACLGSVARAITGKLHLLTVAHNMCLALMLPSRNQLSLALHKTLHFLCAQVCFARKHCPCHVSFRHVITCNTSACA